MIIVIGCLPEYHYFLTHLIVFTMCCGIIPTHFLYLNPVV